MNLRGLINSGINKMECSSNDGCKKQKMFNNQYGENRSYDIGIENVKHEISWSRDFFKF